MTRPFAFIVIGALVASGCAAAPTSSTDVLCTLNLEPALVVYVSDSVSAAPLAARAVGVARDGGFVDTLRPKLFSSAGVLVARSGADERAGTYRVSISVSGYQDWTSAAIVVTRNVCHVNTQTLQARLRPAP